MIIGNFDPDSILPLCVAIQRHLKCHYESLVVVHEEFVHLRHADRVEFAELFRHEGIPVTDYRQGTKS